MSASNADFDTSPEPFRGTRSQVGPFLAQLDEEFKAQPDVFSSDHAKVTYATSNLRGAAMKWVLAHPEATQGTWDQFVKEFCERFGNPDESQTAFGQLKKLKQHGSAKGYLARFNVYAEKAKLDDNTKKNKWFYRGLADDVKDSMMTSDWDWKMDFNAFADMAVKIDTKLHPPHLNEQENRYGQ